MTAQTVRLELLSVDRPDDLAMLKETVMALIEYFDEQPEKIVVNGRLEVWKTTDGFEIFLTPNPT